MWNQQDQPDVGVAVGEPVVHFDEQPLPPSKPDLERLFRLSDNEKRWALELKAAVEASDELDNLSDLQYVQFALANKGNLSKTLERVQGMQDFRHEYQIHDTWEEGMALINGLTTAHPFSILSVAYDDVTENYGLVYDRTRARFDHIRSQDEWRVALGAFYYLFNLLCPDPQSMRNGIFCIGECDGFEHAQTSINKLRIIWDHLLAHLPVYFRSIKFFHTNVAANLSYSMLKLFMRKELTDRIVVGCQFGINISSLFLMPTPEVAVSRTLGRIEMFMKTRYQNEANFSLCVSHVCPHDISSTRQAA